MVAAQRQQVGRKKVVQNPYDSLLRVGADGKLEYVNGVDGSSELLAKLQPQGRAADNVLNTLRIWKIGDFSQLKEQATSVIPEGKAYSFDKDKGVVLTPAGERLERTVRFFAHDFRLSKMQMRKSRDSFNLIVDVERDAVAQIQQKLKDILMPLEHWAKVGIKNEQTFREEMQRAQDIPYILSQQQPFRRLREWYTANMQSVITNTRKNDDSLQVRLAREQQKREALKKSGRLLDVQMSLKRMLNELQTAFVQTKMKYEELARITDGFEVVIDPEMLNAKEMCDVYTSRIDVALSFVKAQLSDQPAVIEVVTDVNSIWKYLSNPIFDGRPPRPRLPASTPTGRRGVGSLRERFGATVEVSRGVAGVAAPVPSGWSKRFVAGVIITLLVLLTAMAPLVMISGFPQQVNSSTGPLTDRFIRQSTDGMPLQSTALMRLAEQPVWTRPILIQNLQPRSADDIIEYPAWAIAGGLAAGGLAAGGGIYKWFQKKPKEKRKGFLRNNLEIAGQLGPSLSFQHMTRTGARW